MTVLLVVLSLVSPTTFAAPVTLDPAAASLESVEAGLKKAIFLDLRDINVVDVLKFLATEGSFNIVTSKNVQGRSTLLLKNVTIQDALDIIVISNQLAYHIRNGIIYVMTEDEYAQMYGKNYNDQKKIRTRTLKYAKPSYVLAALQAIQSALGKIVIDEDTGTVVMIDTAEKLEAMDRLLDKVEHKLETKVVALQYAKAKDVEAQLQPKLDARSVGSIFGDERSNQLVVTAYPGRMKDVLAMIRALDKEKKAVLIELRVLQVTINPQYDFGIDWEKVFNKGGELITKEVDVHYKFPITTSNTSAGTHFWTATLGNLSTTEFAATITELKQVQRTKVLANPRLMVLDREQAKINIGDRVPYVITTQTASGSTTSTAEEIKFIDVGLQVVVTPVINDDGFITMKIRPEISSQINTLTTPTNNTIPVVNTSYVESSLVVKDGVTVILGGLRRDDLKENDRGVPLLMDVPILGALFRSKNEKVIKTELAIFITPKIVTGAKPITDEPPPLKMGPRPPAAQASVKS